MPDFNARIGAVRFKDGYSGGDVVPMPTRFVGDGLINMLTGLGAHGQRGGNRYAFCPLSQAEIETAYRSSGLLRKVIDIPALDMVREGRDWQADNDQIELLEAEEERLGIWAKIKQAEVLRGLGGGALILGAAGEPAMPLNPRGGKGLLAFVHVVSRWQLTLGDLVDDPLDQLFGGPRYFELSTNQGQRRLHPSRVVCFKGDPLTGFAGTSWQDQFWGEGRIQRVLEAVTNSDTAQQAFAALIVKARNTRVGIPKLFDLTATTEGETRLKARLQAIALGESMYNWTMYDAGSGEGKDGEAITDHQVTWTGIPEVMYAFATFLAAVADIPVTRLLGRAAEGMNSSGDSQQRDWNKMVAARQRLELKPCMDQLDVALIPSALGTRPAELWWQFAPLDTPSEAEEATRFKTTMEAVVQLQNTGTIPDIAFSKGVQNLMTENGWIPGLDTALAEVPESERFPEPEPMEVDPSALTEEGGDPARRAANDAKPRTLYVQRKLLNAKEIIAWAKGQGFETTTPAADMHVTICFSRQPVDWMKMGEAWSGDEKGNVTIAPGGPRAVEALGDKGAVVLLFSATDFQYRHRRMIEEGASFDFDEYQPHVTITYAAPEGLDLEKVEPYRGKLVFGPEIFEEVEEDWERGLVEA